MDFKCKTCEAQLTALAEEAQNGLVTCPYCKNVWTVPKKETSPAALSFLRMGEHDLDTCKFEDALSAYQKAAELDPEEPEAYFGMALATYKVQYLKDEVADPPRLQPICHEISEKVFSTDKNYLKAIELATREQKRIYRERAMEIDEIRDRFEELKESGLDYDCFLCVKVTSEDGSNTQDSHEALRIYNYLKEKGYTPFYSEAIMGSRTGSDYEAHILYALYTSECMLIVCSDEEYLKTKWVKNEYTRFSAMIANEEKERDAVTFVYRGKPIEKLPGRNGKLQGIDLAKPTAYAAIADYVERHTPAAKARREAEEKKRRAEEEARNREFSELKEKLAQMERERASAASPANLSPAELLAMMRKAEEEEKRKREDEAPKTEETWLTAEQIVRDEAENSGKTKHPSQRARFQVKRGVLIKYTGTVKEVRIPDNVTKIEGNAFQNCSTLPCLTISNSVTSIGDGAFTGCNGRERIKVLEGNIAYRSEQDCLIDKRSNTLILGCNNSKIPDSVIRIGDSAFALCNGLKNVTIPASVNAIDRYAFANCSGLKSITIDDGVTSIGFSAFYKCSGLTEISIGKNVTSIGRDVFYGCDCLKKICVAEENPNYSSEDGILYNKSKTEIIHVPQAIKTVKLPDSITSIDDKTFSECKSITQVTIPKQINWLTDSGLKKIFGDNWKKIQFTFTK